MNDVKSLNLCDIVKDNGLHKLGFMEPGFVSLPKGDLPLGAVADVALEKMNGYKVMDFKRYDSEAVLVVRKKFGKWLGDFLSGGSEVKELHSVYDKDGNAGPVHACLNYFRNADYMRIGRGKVNTKEKLIAEKYPELVQRSPFSYTPTDDLDLPVNFAKGLHDAMNYYERKRG